MNRMRKDLNKVHSDLVARQTKPVKLRVAAAVAHHELTGRNRDSMPAKEYFRQVNEVARDLARISDLYHVDPGHQQRRVPLADIEQGVFDNGGDVLRLPNGVLYRGLSMRRIDAMNAMAALKIQKG